MKPERLNKIVFFLFFVALLSSCATFKSGLNGEFEGQATKNFKAEKVSVLFVFSHYQQTKGLDAVPKIDYRPVDGFEEIFADAMNELSNIDFYSAFTDMAGDVNNSKRRRLKDSLMHCNDYIIKIRIQSEKSFAAHFFATIGTVITATLVPMPYVYHYTAQVDVLDSDRKLIKSYTREAELTKWWQTFLLFVYPFKHQERQKEQLYVEILHDVFRQIESEKILK